MERYKRLSKNMIFMSGNNKGNAELFSRFLEEVNCNLCGSGKYRRIYKTTYTANNFSKKRIKSFSYASNDNARGNIVECKKCGLVYMTPRDKDINSLYEEVEDTYYFSSKDDRVETFERDLKELESVRNSNKKTGKKIMDIGCNYGFFLDVAEEKGWNVYGCELSKKQFEFASKNHKNVFNCELKKCPLKPNFFDVMTLYDVIEHVPNPSSLLKDCNSLLKKGGIVAVCTPNVSSSIAKFMGKYWLQYARMHIYYFTLKTLKKMLNKNGFRILAVKRHPRILRLGNAIKWTSKYPLVYKVLKRFLDNRMLKNIKFSWYIGDSMTVYAKKVKSL